MRIIVLLGILALGIFGVIVFAHPLALLIKGILAIVAVLLIAVAVITVLEGITLGRKGNEK